MKNVIMFLYSVFLLTPALAMEDTQIQLKKLEFSFSEERYRKDTSYLNKHIHSDFVEIIAIGEKFRKGDIVKLLPAILIRNYTYRDFTMHCFSEKMCRVTYVLEMDHKKTIRSSIWTRNSSVWQIYFHQVTPLVS